MLANASLVVFVATTDAARAGVLRGRPGPAFQTLAAEGVTFEHYGLPGQDETGVWTPPGTSTRVAWFKDPDGNLLSLTQS